MPGHPHNSGGKEYLPQLIAWEVTRFCVLSCKHCRAAAKSTPYSGELDTEQCFKLLDNIASFAKPIIILTGGEPMTRADIYDIAAHGHGLGLPVVMAPCGVLIDDETAAKIVKSGISRISISLDGATAESHDAFRGVDGAFEATIRGRADFADTVHALVAPGSPFADAVGKVGWSVVDRDEVGFERAGFRIVSGEAAVDLIVNRVADEDPAFVRHGGLGFSYRVPRDAEDPTSDPVIMTFLKRMGAIVLEELAKELGLTGAAPSIEALTAFARDLVDTLEAPLREDIAADIDVAHQDRADAPTRHGDRMSYVPA